MQILEQRGFWLSDTDYLHGYTATVELEACLMSTCLDVLIEQNAVLITQGDRLYRLVDTGLFGTEYTIESTDPLVVTPPLPAARLLAYDAQDSLLGRQDRATQLVDNAINGTTTDLYTYAPSVKDLLQSVIDALAAEDTDIAGLLSELEIIAGLLV
jgi:hypothetical protein